MACAAATRSRRTSSERPDPICVLLRETYCISARPERNGAGGCGNAEKRRNWKGNDEKSDEWFRGGSQSWDPRLRVILADPDAAAFPNRLQALLSRTESNPDNCNAGMQRACSIRYLIVYLGQEEDVGCCRSNRQRVKRT